MHLQLDESLQSKLSSEFILVTDKLNTIQDWIVSLPGQRPYTGKQRQNNIRLGENISG